MTDSYHFTDSQTIKFLRLYKKEEVLWNPESPSYLLRDHRRDAIKRIIKEMNLKNLEPRHIRLKIRSHRDVYMREMKRKAKNVNPHKKMPFWIKELSFLAFKLNDSMETSSMDDTAFWESDAQEIIIGPDDEDDQTETEENFINTTTKQEYQDTDNSSTSHREDEIEYNKIGSDPLTESIQNRDIFKVIAHNQEVILQIIRTQNGVDSSKEDIYDKFSKYVASLLRDLPKAKALALQPKIISLITDEHTETG